MKPGMKSENGECKRKNRCSAPGLVIAISIIVDFNRPLLTYIRTPKEKLSLREEEKLGHREGETLGHREKGNLHHRENEIQVTGR